jgi:hypothetical protein
MAGFLSGEPMDSETVTDLYQASFYVLNGCEITSVQCIPSGMATSCQMMVEGRDLTDLAQIWFEKRAVANLASFRQAYNHVYNLCQQAKRNYGINRSFYGEAGR